MARESDVEYLMKEIRALRQEVQELKQRVDESKETNVSKRYLLPGVTSPVAFSAYVTYYQYGLAAQQVIKFDGVLLNDGNAYNKYTGVFTVPVTGVYLVTFYIADRDINAIYVQLTVDNVDISDACAETIQSRHIDQGGNTAIVRLSQGQAMWVEVKYTQNVHIESSANYRFTTFSAVLLYT